MVNAEADLIVKASWVKGKEGVLFCLGPFAERVSFSAQQTRALNLVWALHEDRRFAAGDQVAVIGAGVAGLTAAAALIAHGCSVDIFEAQEETVALQRYTHHRLVHPTINQWPFAELQLTTTFPFLEWFANRCSEVARDIAGQFETLLGNNRLFKEHTVIGISDMATNLLRLKVDPRLADPRGYRLVIVAIGFGEEQSVPSFESVPYWYPDKLEILKERRKVELVSGCGDGGLIDALRLVHKQFDSGQLALDLAHALSNTPIAEAIIRAESEAKRARSVQGLAEVYGGLAKQLDQAPEYAALSARLNKSLDRPGAVFLIDKVLDHPYSLNAAPIHKLMVAHARLVGALNFRKAEAEQAGDVINLAGIQIPGPPTSRIVIRHGPKPEFGRLLSDAEVADLRSRQEPMSDFLATPHWPEPYPVPPPLPPRDPEDVRFIENRVPMARRAVRTLHEDSDIMPLAGRLRVIYGTAIPANAPRQLFGIPVENEVRRTVPEIHG